MTGLRWISMKALLLLHEESLARGQPCDLPRRAGPAGQGTPPLRLGASAEHSCLQRGEHPLGSSGLRCLRAREEPRLRGRQQEGRLPLDWHVPRNQWPQACGRPGGRHPDHPYRRGRGNSTSAAFPAACTRTACRGDSSSHHSLSRAEGSYFRFATVPSTRSWAKL